jgi:hypothetical protein
VKTPNEVTRSIYSLAAHARRLILNIGILAILAVLLVPVAFVACGGDDDGDATSTTTADDTATPSTGETPGTSPGGDDSEVEQRYEELKEEFSQLSEETQGQLQEFWDGLEEAYQSWQDVPEEDRDSMAENFHDTADAIDILLNTVS